MARRISSIQKISERANELGVKCYHFTDRENLGSIELYNGLWSWGHLQDQGIPIPKQGGNRMSMDFDCERGLEDHVRICFVREHHMEYQARQEGRIPNPVYLEIDNSILDQPNVLFSDMNATATGAIIQPGLKGFNNINFNLILHGIRPNGDRFRPGYVPRFPPEKFYWQAEALIPRHISMEYITIPRVRRRR